MKFKEFNELVENESYVNKEYISKIYYSFYIRTLDDEMYNKYLYYDFLFSKDTSNLMRLENTSRFNYYINKMIHNMKDVIALEKIYLFMNNKETLFKLLLKKRM